MSSLDEIDCFLKALLMDALKVTHNLILTGNNECLLGVEELELWIVFALGEFVVRVLDEFRVGLGDVDSVVEAGCLEFVGDGQGKPKDLEEGSVFAKDAENEGAARVDADAKVDLGSLGVVEALHDGCHCDCEFGEFVSTRLEIAVAIEYACDADVGVSHCFHFGDLCEARELRVELIEDGIERADYCFGRDLGAHGIEGDDVGNEDAGLLDVE